MTLFGATGSVKGADGAGPIPASDLDFALTAQIVVAWAGEGQGDATRMGWWRTDLVSKYGGEDLFRELFPHTWRWATLQAVREAARRTDASLRRQEGDPDRVVSLYSFGFETDERLEERLLELKRTADDPRDALSELSDGLRDAWDRDEFSRWLSGHGESDFVAAPLGRRIKGPPPDGLRPLVMRLVAALSPLDERFPMPHFRRPS